jgi:hypothetical protein
MSIFPLRSGVSERTTVLAVRFPEVPLRGPRLLRQTALWIKREIGEGARPAIVVGTHCRWYDRIVELADDAGPSWRVPSGREADRMRAAGDDLAAAMLAAALSALGVAARSIDVRDAELEGDGDFGAGALRHLDARYVAELLAGEIVPVVPGGHVHRPDGETIMLAPGGVDVTAVALAIALGAVPCHFIGGRKQSGPAHRRISRDAVARAQAYDVPVLLRRLDSSSSETLELPGPAILGDRALLSGELR